jgi:hypothetical protein
VLLARLPVRRGIRCAGCGYTDQKTLAIATRYDASQPLIECDGVNPVAISKRLGQKRESYGLKAAAALPQYPAAGEVLVIPQWKVIADVVVLYTWA